MAYTHIAGIGIVNTANTMPNKCNIMTENNVVMLCDDVYLHNYSANSVILTLSKPMMWPLTDIVTPVCVTDSQGTSVVPLTINTSGEFKLQSSYTQATVHLNGLCFNVNSKYYNPSIGNIYDNGTSPLHAR